MSDWHQTPCPNSQSIQSLKSQAGELFTLLRVLTSRVEENTTFLFGPERNGGGWVRSHEREHMEGEVELKETLEILRAGMNTMASSHGELTTKVKDLCDKRSGWRRVLEVSIPAFIAGGAVVVTQLLK